MNNKNLFFVENLGGDGKGGAFAGRGAVPPSYTFGLNSRSEGFDYRFGVFAKSFDTNNKEIRFEYDAYGRMKKVWGPYNIGGLPALSMEYHPEYKGTGSNKTLPHAITKNLEDHEGTRTIDTVIFIDSLKRVIQTQKTTEVFQNGQPVIGMTATGRIVYDLMGRVTDQGQPVFFAGQNYIFRAIDLVNPTKFTYDDQGRTVKVVTPDGNKTTTAYTIEDGWMKTTVTDPNQNTKDSYSDLYSKIMKIVEHGDVVEKYNGDTPVIRRHDIKTEYEYSPVGEILTVLDADKNETTVTYDLLGRRTSIDNKDTGLTSFVYDIAGNLVEKRTANLQADNKEPIRYEYDFNRLLKINYPGDETDVVYTYGDANAKNNRAGRILSISDDSGLTELSYGSLGEVIQTDKTITTRSGQTKTYVTRQSFDSFGRMKELIYPDGEVLKYTYDAGGLLQSATGFKDRVTYNYLNYLGYDHFGQRVYMELGNKTKTRYQYDPLTRRMSNLQTEGKDGKLQDIAYTYDDVGNILSITDSARNSVTQNFTYDGLYRLVSANGTYDSSRSPDGRTLHIIVNIVMTISII